MGVAAIGLAVTAGSAIIGAIGKKQEGKALKNQAAFQASVARNNAILSERAAQDAIVRGREAERERRVKTRQLIGRQRTALAGAGQVVDTGSALDITEETAAIGELDALTIRRNAEREALGFRTEGINFQSSALLADLRGESAERAGDLAFKTTLLTGAGSVASKWYQFRQGTS